MTTLYSSFVEPVKTEYEMEIQDDISTKHLQIQDGIAWRDIMNFPFNQEYSLNNIDIYQLNDLDDVDCGDILHALSSANIFNPCSTDYTLVPCSSDIDSDRDDLSVQLDDTGELPGFSPHDEAYFSHYTYSPQSTESDASSPINESRLPSFDILAASVPHRAPRMSADNFQDSDNDSNQIERPGKRGAKNILLWKFLLEELKSNSDSIRWVSKREGTFKFMDTVEISKKWGKKKNKDDMNFEKLSRGIRHYYRNKFMTRIEGCRLMYRFNWTKIPKRWRPFDS